MVRGHAPGNDAGCLERAGRGTAWRRLGRAGPHGQSQQLVTAATWDRRIHVQRSLASADAGKRRERGTPVPGERLHDLRGGPRSGGVLGDVAMHHAENSHQPARQRERRREGLKSPEQVQRFLAAYGPIAQPFRPRCYRLSASEDRQATHTRCHTWRESTDRAMAAEAERRSERGPLASCWDLQTILPPLRCQRPRKAFPRPQEETVR